MDLVPVAMQVAELAGNELKSLRSAAIGASRARTRRHSGCNSEADRHPRPRPRSRASRPAQRWPARINPLEAEQRHSDRRMLERRLEAVLGLRAAPSWARRSSVTSRETPTAPVTSPERSRIGESVLAIVSSVPSRRRRVVSRRTTSPADHAGRATRRRPSVLGHEGLGLLAERLALAVAVERGGRVVPARRSARRRRRRRSRRHCARSTRRGAPASLPCAHGR